MTSKEVVKEILKMITAMNRTELTFMTKNGVPIAQFKKEDVEQAEKDLDKLNQLEEILEKYIITNLEELGKILDENLKQFTQMGYVIELGKTIIKSKKELGIDLITLFKAQTQGFYIINVCDEIEKVKLSEWRFNLIKKEVHRVKRNKHLSFADYGKTWALTKEELENESNND